MSTIIYEPRVVLNLREIVGGSIVRASLLALTDFIAQENQSWEYYLGAAFGYAAAATGIPNAAGTLYVIGSTLDTVLLHSPEGSSVEVFLNGILIATVDTYAAENNWQGLSISLIAGLVNRVDFVNRVNTNPSKSSEINWLALGAFEITGDSPFIFGGYGMAYNTMVFRTRDDEEDSPDGAIPLYLPQGLTIAQYQTYADAVAPEVDALIESQIVGIDLTLSLTVVGGLKGAPVAGALNERGGLITFDTTGPRADSVRLPAILHALMPGDSFALTDTDVAALITRLTTATTAASIRPRTSQDYQFSSARAGKKSLRRR